MKEKEKKDLRLRFRITNIHPEKTEQAVCHVRKQLYDVFKKYETPV